MLQVLEFRMVTQAARERVSFTLFTFTTPSFWYSFHFAPSELNRSLYDVTHWSYEGLPCVAILFTTLSFPRSICKYCPIAFWSADQEPELPLFWILLRRACHGSYSNAQDEDAFTASFGISLFSIPRGWMRHSVGRNTNPSLFTFTSSSYSNQAHRGHGFDSRWRNLKNIQVHLWDNRWDCPANVRIISSILSLNHRREHMNQQVPIWVASMLSWKKHYTGIAKVMGSNPVEDTWKIFRCTYETMAEIVQQGWGSFH